MKLKFTALLLFVVAVALPVWTSVSVEGQSAVFGSTVPIAPAAGPMGSRSTDDGHGCED